jgi:hypothetical protein
MSRVVCTLLVAALCLHSALALMTNPRTRRSSFLKQQFESAHKEVLQEMKERELQGTPPQLQAADLRGTGLRAVENQGSCGSCVAFGSVHTIQDTFRGCGLPKLSTQHVLNCRLSCANGGYISSAYSQLAFPGITTESCMRYRATDGWCSWLGLFSYCDSGSLPSQYFRHGSTCTFYEPLLRAWLDIGRPFTIGMQLQGKFRDHGNPTVAANSVYPRATGDTAIIGGHAMEVVGYGTLGGVDYWLVKNSWGSGWGDGGFVKIRRHPYNGFFGIIGTEYFGTGCRPTVSGTCPTMSSVTHEQMQSVNPKSESDFQLYDDDLPGEVNVTDIYNPNAPIPGGNGPVDKNHPLIQEAAYFAVHVLLSTPKNEGGFECLPELPIRDDFNNSISGPSLEAADVHAEVVQAQSAVTVHSADQRIVGGVSLHFLFTFSNTDPRCTNPSGTYDATVYISGDGYLVMQGIFKSIPPPEAEGIDVGAVVGGSVAAFVVVCAVGGYVGLRWYRTRGRYKKLKDIHQEVINRVSILEQGPSGDPIRAAALSTLLKSSDEFRVKKGGAPVKLHDRKPKDNVAPAQTTSV